VLCVCGWVLTRARVQLCQYGPTHCRHRTSTTCTHSSVPVLQTGHPKSNPNLYPYPNPNPVHSPQKALHVVR